MLELNVFAPDKPGSIDREFLGQCSSKCVVISATNLDSLDALSDRLAKLEKSKGDGSTFSSPSPANDECQTGPSSPQTQSMEAPKSSSKRKYQSSYAARDISPVSGRADPKRRISQSFGSSIHVQRHSPSSDQHASEAREYIEHELKCNPALSKDRRTALEMAQRFVSQLSNPGIHRENGGIDQLEIEDVAPPTLTPELLYMMLPGKTHLLLFLAVY